MERLGEKIEQAKKALQRPLEGISGDQKWADIGVLQWYSEHLDNINDPKQRAESDAVSAKIRELMELSTLPETRETLTEE